jgi:hypothetical protein
MRRCKECAVGLLGACSLDYCQTEREVLIERAQKDARAHGHTLAGFAKIKSHPIWQATCSLCGQTAAINLDPPTGESDIYGEAVANACPEAGVSAIAAGQERDTDDAMAWYNELSSPEMEA